MRLQGQKKLFTSLSSLFDFFFLPNCGLKMAPGLLPWPQDHQKPNEALFPFSVRSQVGKHSSWKCRDCGWQGRGGDGLEEGAAPQAASKEQQFQPAAIPHVRRPELK